MLRLSRKPGLNPVLQVPGIVGRKSVVLQFREELSAAERLLVSAAIVLGERPTPSRQEEA